MSLRILSQETKITRHSNAVAAGTTDISPANGIDMQGFDGVLFIVPFGAITATAVTSIKAQQSTAVDGTGDAFADIAGTAVTVADDDDNKIAYLDVVRPTERFVRLVVDRGTANAVVDGIIAIQYKARSKPTTHDATTVLGGELHEDKAEGTA